MQKYKMPESVKVSKEELDRLKVLNALRRLEKRKETQTTTKEQKNA